MNIKEELLNVFCTRMSDFQHILNTCKESNISGPFLMSPNEKYAKQPYPFLAIGQETNGWGMCADIVSEEECKKMMSVYEDFNVGEKYYSSPFWNMIRKIETALGNESYSCAFTNISKFDYNCGRPDSEHEKIFSILDDLLIDEINIIKPKICLFFTSYQFDYRLENIFKQVEFMETVGFDKNTLCLLKHPNLPTLSFRTYHPGYLRRSGKEDSIVDFIRSQTVGKL